jgi:hypothetical protein
MVTGGAAAVPNATGYPGECRNRVDQTRRRARPELPIPELAESSRFLTLRRRYYSWLLND